MLRSEKFVTESFALSDGIVVSPSWRFHRNNECHGESKRFTSERFANVYESWPRTMWTSAVQCARRSWKQPAMDRGGGVGEEMDERRRWNRRGRAGDMRDVCCVVGRNVFAYRCSHGVDTALTKLWNRRTRRAKREREQNKRWKRDKRKRRVCAYERATVSTCESAVPAGLVALYAGRSFVFDVLVKFFRFYLPFEYAAVGHTPGPDTLVYDTTVPPPPRPAGRFEYLPNDPSPLPAATADSHRSADFICPLYYPHGSVLFLSTGFSFIFTPQSNHSTVSARRLWQIHYYVPLRVHSGHCQHPKPSNRLDSPPPICASFISTLLTAFSSSVPLQSPNIPFNGQSGVYSWRDARYEWTSDVMIKWVVPCAHYSNEYTATLHTATAFRGL